MTSRARMCVFINRGGANEKLNTKLRQVFGDVHIVLVFPKGCPPGDTDRCGADEVMIMAKSGLRPALVNAIVELRKQRVDGMILLYDSVKLRVFAALVKPRQCLWWRGDGYVVPLPASVPGTLWQHACLRVRGMASLLRIFRSIYLGRFHIPTPKD